MMGETVLRKLVKRQTASLEYVTDLMREMLCDM